MQMTSLGVATEAGVWVAHTLGEAGDWVLCWPAMMADHRSMLDFAQALSHKYRVILIDPPGFYANRSVTTWPGLFGMVRPVLNILDAFGADQVHWVGQGFGGHVGAAVLAKSSERVLSITLGSVPLVQTARANLFTRVLGRWLMGHRWGRAKSIERLCTRLVTQGSDERLLIEKNLRAAVESANVAVLRALKPTPQLQLTAMLKTLRTDPTPKLVIAGERDAMCLPRDQKTAAELMPRTRYAELSCGFMSFLARPEQTAAAFDSFVRNNTQ